MPVELRVLVIGRGIAGMATALSLSRIEGVHVTLAGEEIEGHEQRAMVLWSSALGALRWILSAEQLSELYAHASGLERLDFCAWDGTPLWPMPTGALGREAGAPPLMICHSALATVLNRAVREPTSKISFRSGTVCLKKMDPHAAEPMDDFDVVVGADGRCSGVRTELTRAFEAREREEWKRGLPPRRLVPWQGTRPAYQDAFVSTVPLNDKLRALIRPGVAFTGSNCEARFSAGYVNPELGYWYISVKRAPGAKRPSLGCYNENSHDCVGVRGETLSGIKDALLELLSDCGCPVWPLIEASRTDVQKIQWAPVSDQLPDAPWGVGNVTLVGDAAHTLTPDLAYGACLGIEGAVTLAAALDSAVHGGAKSTAAALRAYERRQLERVAAIGELSWSAALAVMPEHPALNRVRDAVTTSLMPSISVAQLRWMMGYRVPLPPERRSRALRTAPSLGAVQVVAVDEKA